MTIVLKNKQEIKIDGYLNGTVRFENNGKEIHIFTLGKEEAEIIKTKDISSMF